MKLKEVWYRAGLLVFFAFCAAESAPAAAAPRHAQVELLAQTTSIAPGRGTWLAVHFQLDPGWHIYWINPGDSGQPPVLKWQLPPGFIAGEIRWPFPDKLRNSQLADYGYKDDVALLAPLQVPQGLREGDRAEIGLQASWLVCREVCIPEYRWRWLYTYRDMDIYNSCGW